MAALTGWWQLFGLLAVDVALGVCFGPRSPLAQVALRLLRPQIVAFGLLGWTVCSPV